MKTVFLLDVFDNGKQIYLNTRDENGIAHVLRIESIKRTLFYVFSDKVDFEPCDIITNYLQKVGIPSENVKLCNRLMGMIHPETREMTGPKKVVQVIFNRSLFFTLAQRSNMEKLPSVVEHVTGMDFTPVEYLLGYNNLKGWIKFNDQHPSVKKIETKSIFQKREQYSLSQTDHVLLGVKEQPPTPALLIFSIYENHATSLFAISSSDGSVEEYGLEDIDVNNIIAKHNPSVICVHDLETLSSKILIRDATMDKRNTRRIDQLIVDTFAYAKELKPMEKDYSLEALMKENSSSSSSSRVIEDVERAKNILKLAQEMGAVELIFQISTRTGQPCSKVPSRLGRVEWMLLSRFIENRCIPPDRMPNSVAIKKSKESYTAGLVLEPKCGIYEAPVLLLDFRSLYPSICIEYTVCYTGNGSIIPFVLKQLVEKRKLLKDASMTCKKTAIMCTALKLLANATYGCLACPWSRFYSVNIAKKITQYGRDQLTNTMHLVKSRFKMDVIYGDTDSLLVATIPGTTQEETDAYALEIISTVNAKYNYLELEYEASFDCFALFGKKHYVGIKRDRGGKLRQEIKGLDLIKRGFSPIGSRVSKQIVDFILSEEGRNEETAVFDMVGALLRETSGDIRTGKLLLSDFVITTELSRNLEDYKDTAGLYHVQAALKQQCTASGRSFQKGDFVKFVMGEGTNPIPYERAWDNTLVVKLGFKLDLGWYLRQMTSMIDRLLVIYPSYNIHLIQEAVSLSSLDAARRATTSTRMPSSSSSSSSSKQYSLKKDSDSDPNSFQSYLLKERHPTNHIKARHSVSLECTHCREKKKYIGFCNLEIAALNISQNEPDKHAHIDKEMIEKLLPKNLIQCPNCEKKYDFVFFFDTLVKEEWDAFLLNINLKRVIRQFTCLECRENLFSFFQKQKITEYFFRYIQ